LFKVGCIRRNVLSVEMPAALAFPRLELLFHFCFIFVSFLFHLFQVGWIRRNVFSVEMPAALAFPRLELLLLLAVLPGYTNACASLIRDGDLVSPNSKP
jgi:hypothetical protein